MNCAKYLIVGGGLSGHNAAKAIRQADPQGGITVLGDESNRPYDRPPLTKGFMRGQTPADKTFYEEPDWYVRQDIRLLLDSRVERLDAQAKTVRLADGSEWSFQKALLAMGGRPVKLTLPGIDLPGVHYFRTLDDAVAVANKVASGGAVAIIGGGFIGMELASSLTMRGAKVTVIDGGPHVWSRFADETLAGFFTRYCRERGVTFLSGEKVSRVAGVPPASFCCCSEGKTKTTGNCKDEGETPSTHADKPLGPPSGMPATHFTAPTSVITASGKIVPCDMVIVAAGIVPNVKLAAEAGLAVDNGVIVNAQLQTSNQDVYAAGDLCNYFDPHFERRRRVEHWGQADYTGTLAGQNMAGAANSYNLLTYVFSDIFDLHLEFAGDEHGYDRTIIRGRMEDKAFSVLYLRNDRLTAHFSVNLKRKQFGPLQKLIERKANLAGKDAQLADMNFDVATLAEPVVGRLGVV